MRGAGVRDGSVTRQLIYEAALDAFAERGYAASSLRDIARRVGIEVPSLYNHIASKEDLLFRIIDRTSHELLADLRAAVASAPEDDPREALIQAIAANVTFHATHPRNSYVGNVELRFLSPEHREEAIRLRGEVEAIFKDRVQACIAAGYLPMDTEVTVTAYLLLGLGTSVPGWFDESGPLKPSDVARAANDLVFHGLQDRRPAKASQGSARAASMRR